MVGRPVIAYTRSWRAVISAPTTPGNAGQCIGMNFDVPKQRPERRLFSGSCLLCADGEPWRRAIASLVHCQFGIAANFFNGKDRARNTAEESEGRHMTLAEGLADLRQGDCGRKPREAVSMGLYH